MRAQLDGHDSLGWLVDLAEAGKMSGACPKACARAKAALIAERELLATAQQSAVEARAALGAYWMTSPGSLADGIRAKCAMLERMADKTEDGNG